MKKDKKFFLITLALVLLVIAPLIESGLIFKDKVVRDKDSDKTKEVIAISDNEYGDFSYLKYNNARFGFSIEYPSFFNDIKESKNGDGVILQNIDKNVVLILTGINNTSNKTAEEFFNEYISNTNNIVHKKYFGNCFMIASENNNMVYFIYEAVGSGSLNSFIIGYPKKDKEVFDGIIKHLKQTFETPYIHESK